MKPTPRDLIRQLVPQRLLDAYRRVRYCRKADRHSVNGDINRAALWHTSQAGQDYWVYGEVFNEMREGFFVDVGAHDGVYLSNTYLLEKRYHWKGICVEANRGTFESLKVARSATCINACVDSGVRSVQFNENSVLGGIIGSDCDNISADSAFVVQIETQTLDAILRSCNAPKEIDYLSIDIEGAEDRALLTFPFNDFMFRSITIERPSLKLRSVLQENGYVLIKEVPGLDCFYIHSTWQSNYHRNTVLFHEKKIVIHSLNGQNLDCDVR
jgi:FkbM family methyltransferase